MLYSAVVDDERLINVSIRFLKDARTLNFLKINKERKRYSIIYCT